MFKQQQIEATTEGTKVGFRKTGKVHRGWFMKDDRGTWLRCACSCPGSNNGSLKNGARIVCEGWEKANCEG